MTQHYYGRKIVLAWEEEKDGVAGYAVTYRDGYRSWCPKDKFEEENIALGHKLGMYTYEMQKVLARIAEIDVLLLEIATDESEIGRMERECLSLMQGILLKRVEAYDAEFLKDQPVTEQEPKETIAHTGQPNKPYFLVPFADIKDFNFFRAMASTVPTEREIANVKLIEVLQNGHRLEVEDALWGRVEGGIQIAGRLPGIGIFNMVADPITGNINAASRPASAGSFADVMMALQVELVPLEVVNDSTEPAEA